MKGRAASTWNPLCKCIKHLTISSFLSSRMLQAVSALLHLSITVIWAPFPKIIIRWVAALCLECQLGSDVPKSINYAAQNMKSFNREADVTSLFRVFLPLQTWQSRLSLWSSAKMRRNCQRKLLTSCVPCDKVSQTLTGTASVDFALRAKKKKEERSKSTTSVRRWELRSKAEICRAATEGEVLCAKSLKSFKSMY